jgi:dihydroflavonol-4-reductase
VGYTATVRRDEMDRGGAVAAEREAGLSALSPVVSEEETSEWRRTLPDAVAVTGATGFLGYHLVAALERCGRRPRLLVRDPSRLAPELAAGAEIVTGDLDDRAALHRLVADCSVVLHLAGVVRAARAAHFHRANARGTANVVAAVRARGSKPRLVYVSSLAAAGPSPRPEGRGPEEPPAPISAYGRSKLDGERAVRSLSTPWVILRPPAVYGPRDTDMLQFFRLAAGGVVPLPAGERFVTLAHASDVVRGILQAASGRVDGRILHLGEPSPRPMQRLVAEMARAGGVEARVVPIPAALIRVLGAVGDALHWVGWQRLALTSDKARELCARHWSSRTVESLQALGVAGTVPFPEGAAQTWAWYRQVGWVPRAKMHGERSRR